MYFKINSIQYCWCCLIINSKNDRTYHNCRLAIKLCSSSIAPNYCRQYISNL